MALPLVRSKLLPVRGLKASLDAVVADLVEGEICYATDEDQYYQKESGVLVQVGANKTQGALADSATQPGDNVSTLTNDAGYITSAALPGSTDDLSEGSTNLYSQWDAATGGINYAGGNVGIGTSIPQQKLHVSGDGTQRIRIEEESSGLYTQIVQTSTDNAIVAAGGANNITFITDNGSGTFERMRLDSSGRLLIGTSTARGNFFNSIVQPHTQLEGATDFTRQSAIISSSSTAAHGAVQILAHQKSGSIGGNTLVAANDALGMLSFQGSDGTQFVEGARIEAWADGTPGANSMAARLVFSTTVDGASSPTERMRIKSNGIVNISNMPTHADDSAAGSGGLVSGDLYKTSTGELRIKL